MRATSPYSIGALAGKGMHDACRVQALKAIALAALVFCLSGTTARADAGAESDNAVATLCGIVEASAKAEGLPPDFFTKLIWRESSFRPNAVSPAGAQGVAQFMPGTANERGLIDPFDPASAIPASARFLNELRLRFGNLGLAAAAYNAGPTAVAHWLAKKGSLPFETQDYVLAVTGHDAEEWRSDKPPADAALDTGPSCLSLVATLRVTAPSSVVSGWFAPWGVQIAASFSKGSALRAFARARHDYASVIGDMKSVRARLRSAQPWLAAVLPRPPARSDRRRSEKALRADPGRRRRLRRLEELSGALKVRDQGVETRRPVTTEAPTAAPAPIQRQRGTAPIGRAVRSHSMSAAAAAVIARCAAPPVIVASINGQHEAAHQPADWTP